MKNYIIAIWVAAAITISASLGRGQTVVDVLPTVETEPVYGDGDDADDAAIWIHPTDPFLSTIIGVSKNSDGGLHVYGLDGTQIQFLQFGKINNVDIRYNFPLRDKKVTLVTASNRSNNSIAVFKVNPSTRRLENAVVHTIKTGLGEIYGLCMYHSQKNSKFYSIVNDKEGNVEQWELCESGNGKVDAKPVRSFSVGSQTEGCVADDELGKLYIGEESVGIWKYDAEPTDGEARTQVDQCDGGHLRADVEGLTIYYGSSGTGYLIASSQGNSTFVIYERQSENKYVGTFRIAAKGSIDGCSGTDGIDVTNVNVGTAFPKGLFVAHDNENSGAGTSNYKLVPWDSIAKAFEPALKMETFWNPREIIR